MASATLQQAPEASEKVNPFGRLIGVIFSPKETFDSIVRKPSWLLPAVLFCLATLGVVGAFGSRPGAWRAYMEKQVESSSRFQQLPADQQQRTLEAQVKYAPIFAYPEVAIVDFLVFLTMALVLWGAFSVGVGIKLNFKTSLAIVTHAYVPFILSGLLAIVVILLKDPTQIDLNNPLAADVGSFLPTGMSKPLVAAAHSLDIFSFWVIALVAMGYSAVNPKKLKFGAALAWVIGLWLIYVAIKTGLVAAFS